MPVARSSAPVISAWDACAVSVTALLVCHWRSPMVYCSDVFYVLCFALHEKNAAKQKG